MTTDDARKTILVVDDAEDIHDLIEARLGAAYQILHAYDGEGAFDMAWNQAPDLILLDLDLDGESGLDLCARVRATTRLSYTPIIFLTGDAKIDTKVEAFNAGAVDYVTKPFDAAELRARVGAALRTAQRPARHMVDSGEVPKTLLSGRYEIRDKLGSGGFGSVYQAYDTTTEKLVAIKLLHPQFTHDRDIVSRLRREAQAAHIARHPHVVRVIEVGTDTSGGPYIVQELLRGMTLAQRIASTGALGVERALTILTPIIDAVAVAHRQGVVHRDLKPENIFLVESDPEGEVTPKILDFGISKLAHKPGQHPLTSAGVVLGTPGYISPEQISGDGAVEATTDVWSLGVILYEVISGQRPFVADPPWKLFMVTLSAKPKPLRDLVPSAPEALERILRRCLQREPAARYPSASELAVALRDLNLSA